MSLKQRIENRIKHNEKRFKQVNDIPPDKRTIHAEKQISYYSGKIDAFHLVLGEIEKIIKIKRYNLS
jgi:hypothetical protein